jgi:hypothetical protein
MPRSLRDGDIDSGAAMGWAADQLAALIKLTINAVIALPAAGAAPVADSPEIRLTREDEVGPGPVEGPQSQGAPWVVTAWRGHDLHRDRRRPERLARRVDVGLVAGSVQPVEPPGLGWLLACLPASGQSTTAR